VCSARYYLWLLAYLSVFSAGKTVEMPILQNIVLYLSQQVEKGMKAAVADDSSLLAKLVKDMPAAGRKLLGVRAQMDRRTGSLD